jgi:hypothetical protein
LQTNFDGDVNWQREENGQWIDIACGASYLLNGNDVGKRVRAAAQTAASEPTGIVVLESDAGSCLKAIVRAKALKFHAETSRGGLTWTVLIDEASVTLRARGTPDKVAKWATVECAAVAGTKDDMFLWLDPSAKFVMKPNLLADPRLAREVGTSVRDFIVVLINQLALLAKP